jgi:hypothetical protein
VPIAVVLVWLWLNPRVFAPVETPTSWTSKGIYGEKLWLKERDRVPPDHPTVFGACLIVLAQLWRIDRLVVFYEGTR